MARPLRLAPPVTRAALPASGADVSRDWVFPGSAIADLSKDGLYQGRTFPQGLKPHFNCGTFGTGKPVPLSNTRNNFYL
jgi:hypothetical protein